MLDKTSAPLEYKFRSAKQCNMCGAAQERLNAIGMRLNKSQGYEPKKLTGIAVGVRQCDSCGLIFADPQPEPMRFEDHYRDSSTYWHDEYFEDDHHYFAEEIADAKSLIGDVSRPKALDIGAGIGKAMHALEAAGFDTFGIEPSEEFRKVGLDRGIDPDRLKLAGVEKAAFEPATFDFVTFGAVLEHLPSPSESLSRALMWLKPGGVIQAEVPSSNWLIARLINSYFRLRGTNYVTNLSPMHSPYHLFEFDLRSFEMHGARAGYEVALYRYSVCVIGRFPKLVHPLLRWYMDRTNTGMQLTVYLRKLGRGAGQILANASGIDR